jgi:hypothetical protein
MKFENQKIKESTKNKNLLRAVCNKVISTLPLTSELFFTNGTLGEKWNVQKVPAT